MAEAKKHISPIVSALVSALVVLAGVFAVYTLIRDAKRDHLQLLAALSKNNQEAVLLNLIDEKVQAPMEIKVAMTRTIISMASVKRIPVSLICGVIDVETGRTWKTDLVSPSGAIGFMQIMPATGRPYLRAERIDPTSVALLDPVNNIICGISVLADYRDQSWELKKEKEGNYGVTLAMYNMGPRATEPTSYSNAVLAAAKIYEAKGL